MRKRRLRPFRVVAATTVLVLPLFAVLPMAAANAVSGAISTTDNPNYVDNGINDTLTNLACLNGPSHTTPETNCNIYTQKQDVWLSGLPISAALGDGTYFFAVLDPGSQNPGPNDQAAGNLSTSDTFADRTFTVSGGVMSYSGTTHEFDSSYHQIQLFPYDDTSNPGGVYILAVCAVPSSPSPGSGAGAPGVNPSVCKYDAFKVTGGNTTQASPPTILKDAAGSFDRTYTWSITKSACLHGTSGAQCQTSVSKAVGQSVSFDYIVKATYAVGSPTNIEVTGTIQVYNPNVGDMSGYVTDQLSDLTDCSVTGGGDANNHITLSPGTNNFAYECDLSALPQGTLNNTATVNWDAYSNTDGDLAAGNTGFTFHSIVFTENSTDRCATVTDTFNGGLPDTLGTVCVGNSPTPANKPSWVTITPDLSTNTFTFTYPRTIIASLGCVAYQNTATVTGSDLQTGVDSNTVTVTVCGRSGALTMGFWQNKNGQGIIKAYCAPAGGTSLQAYLTGFNPFKDAPAACGTVGSTATTNLVGYTYSIIKAATCSGPASGPCNKMLRAQMLATALDVYFSDPGLGGNRIGAFNGLGGAQPNIGSLKIDLTHICTMLDGSGGSATCTGVYTDASNVFGVDSPGCKAVSYLLGYSNADGTPYGNGNPVATANTGASWYLNNKPKQVLAKNTFDATNNEVVNGC